MELCICVRRQADGCQRVRDMLVKVRWRILSVNEPGAPESEATVDCSGLDFPSSVKLRKNTSRQNPN